MPTTSSRKITDDEQKLTPSHARQVGNNFSDISIVFKNVQFRHKASSSSRAGWGEGTLAQYAGRLHREYYGKTEVIIYDYLDASVPVLARMHGKRLRGYAAQGYEVER